MTKDGVIVDTSVLIDFLKNRAPNAHAVETLIYGKQVFTTGIIMAELLQGVRNSKEQEYVAELIDGIPAIEVTSVIWLKAGKLAYALRRKGLTLPLTDIAIAATAIEHNLQIFSLDSHFAQIPGVKLYQG